MAVTQQAVRTDATQHTSDGSAQGRKCHREASAQNRHVTRLHQVNREPRDEEVGERRNAELAEVDSDQHPLAEQLFYTAPRYRICCRLRSFGTIQIREPSALLNVINLRGRNQRMLLHVVDSLPPQKCEPKTEDSHEPEAASPAIAVHQPAKHRSKHHQCEVL